MSATYYSDCCHRSNVCEKLIQEGNLVPSYGANPIYFRDGRAGVKSRQLFPLSSKLPAESNKKVNHEMESICRDSIKHVGGSFGEREHGGEKRSPKGVCNAISRPPKFPGVFP